MKSSRDIADAAISREFWRRVRKTEKPKQRARFILTRDQQRFLRQWKKANRTPEEKAYDEWSRAENWRLLALVLAWLLVLGWLLR